MTTDYRVPYTTILDITPHPNAHSLVLGKVYGWQVVLPKDEYQIGSKIIFIPIDSILPVEIEQLLFDETSKIKLEKARIRQIRIRGQVSSGLVVNPEELSSLINLSKIELETDLSDKLNIKKYEPLNTNNSSLIKKSNGRKALAHPDFHSYNGLQNIKWNESTFKEGEEVVIQEKLHGTNARAAKLPFRATTLWKKIKKFFGYAPAYENLYGSNRVDISNASTYNGYYGEDVYGAVFAKLDVFNKIEQNETIFGEIVGPGIQKGYSYGLIEHKFVLFDVKVLQEDGSQVWLKPDQVEAYAKMRGFEMVPILYKGGFNKRDAYLMTFGKSRYNDMSEPVREGIVIKSANDYSQMGNKRALKYISEEYLGNKDNTDFH